MIVYRTAIYAACLVAGFAAAAAGARAQSGQNVPNALQGFSNNRDKPVQIRAQSFEIRDKDKKATFSGNVHVVQGDATIRCRQLVVTYASDVGANVAAGARMGQAEIGGGKTQISKLEAIGGVVVTQKDQTATGDIGVFDMNTKIITLTGNVVISQGGNVMKGDRMVVDLNNGVSRIEAGKTKGPVQMMIQQSGQGGATSGKPPSNGLMPGLPTAPPRFDLVPGQPN